MTTDFPNPASEECRSLNSILAHVGDKWTVLIVVLLGDGPKRFNEIKRMVGGISQRMLTFTLRGLERDGLVTRLSFRPLPRVWITN
jgi:DNA-binding HxlR family transcriptional regulator